MNIHFNEKVNFNTLKAMEIILKKWNDELNKLNVMIEVYNNLIFIKKYKFSGSSKKAVFKFDLKNKNFKFYLENEKLEHGQFIKFDFQFKEIYDLFKVYSLNECMKSKKGDQLEYINNLFHHFKKELAIF